jgi:adenylate kinase
MNVFVAGIHGVGKTYLASRVAPRVSRIHTSASKLIKEERALATWTDDKRVTDVDANQQALAAAVRRHNEAGTRLLLDGHFVLLNAAGEMIMLQVDVFAALNLDGIILVEADPQSVAERIEARDRRKVSLVELRAFSDAERDQAKIVCKELEIPLHVLVSPSAEEFAAAIVDCQLPRDEAARASE